MEQHLMQERVFSELPGLQQAKSIRYTLMACREREHTYYGIRVDEISVGGVLGEEVCAFTENRLFAQRLLTYLYENAVAAAHCVSVISDVCAAADWQAWEERDAKTPDQVAHCG